MVSEYIVFISPVGEADLNNGEYKYDREKAGIKKSGPHETDNF
jgi:hypothetical protein